MKVYYVSCDRQGGCFGMGRLFTAYEWLEQAVDWLDSDGIEEEDKAEFLYSWLHEINNGNGDKLIDYIADYWELELTEGDMGEGIPEEFDPWNDEW